MKRFFTILLGAGSLVYILGLVLGRFLNIPSYIFTTSLGIILTSQAYLSYERYKESKRVLDIMIPALFLILLAYLFFISITK